MDLTTVWPMIPRVCIWMIGREFSWEEQVLVFNSHLKDPLIIEKVSPNETMELKDPESNQMSKVNGQTLEGRHHTNKYS